MPSARTLIVGDIHGCLDMLKRLVDKIRWDPGADRLVFIGDYIDRGENSKGVIDFIIELKKDSQFVQCLIGNHEQMFLDYLSGSDLNSFIANGGLTTLRSYKQAQREAEEPLIPASHLDYFASLVTMVELDEYYVVHAGFRPGRPLEEQDLFDMVWIRDEFIYSSYDFGKTVIFGHTPLYEPMVLENKIGIDTGAVYGNRLTCLEIPESRFHSVTPK
ncbi:MAG: serine/threonine protein phosphatase [Deltaproteobacteria bacterium]|nr:MAG: serine/threonine protein phosphatase [Deltaproteobacteria bacterium]